MPTARELLEQADAMMRRNRAAGTEAAKPATPLPAASIEPGLVSPRSIQREPIVPSFDQPADASSVAAEFALGAEPSIDPQGVQEAAEDANDEGVDVPMLTDAVDVETLRPAFSASVDEGLDDVPLLTDVVEEIEVTVAGDLLDRGIDDPDRGAPSEWREDDDGDDASLLGPAPDSIAAVPSFAESVASGPRDAWPGRRDPLGLDQPAPGFAPALSARAETSWAREAADEVLEDEQAIVALSTPAGSSIEEADGADDGREPPDAQAPLAAEAFDREAAASPVEHLAASSPSPVHGVAASDAADPPEGDERDETRIRMIAEEIGMQLLQRIDIFADTRLREQLGERLRPVVERVSAELVDALNQQVGELLRAYVADAIEREMQTWRDRRSP